MCKHLVAILARLHLCENLLLAINGYSLKFLSIWQRDKKETVNAYYIE